MTALLRVALVAADVPVPRGHADGLDEVRMVHKVFEIDAEPVLDVLDEARAKGLEASHMGRGPGTDRLFFLAAGAAGIHAASHLEEA
jgi:hypothetical protein